MKKACLLLILMMGFATMASAETVSLVDAGYGLNVRIGYNSLEMNNPYFAGEILVTLDDSNPFAAYCLSVAYGFNDSQEVTVKPLSTMTDVDNPGVDAGSAAYVAWLLNTYAFDVDSDVKGAALQLAIWEVLYDTSPAGYDLTDGQFALLDLDPTDPFYGYYNGSQIDEAKSLAATYWASMGTSEAFWFDTANLENMTGQDLGAPIPEPGSLLLLSSGLGALGLAFIRRRR